jgi:hypothetical protein
MVLSEADTKRKILDVAEEPFPERGFLNRSLRWKREHRWPRRLMLMARSMISRSAITGPARLLITLPLVFLPLIIAACGSMPAVDPPRLDMGIPFESWGVEDSTRVAVVADTVLIELSWWESFGDSTLNLLVEEALVSNYDLQAAAARVEQALAEARVTRSQSIPQASAGLNAQRAKQNFLGFPIPGSGDGPSTSITSIYGLSADFSWELDLWGRLRDATSASLADAQAAVADYAGAQLSLSGTTSKAWFRVLEARYQYELSAETVRTFERTVNATRSRFARHLRSICVWRWWTTTPRSHCGRLDCNSWTRRSANWKSCSAATPRLTWSSSRHFPAGWIPCRRGCPPT